MLAYLMLALSLQSTPYARLNACETYAPRLDGTQVTVCGGTVVRVTYSWPPRPKPKRKDRKP